MGILDRIDNAIAGDVCPCGAPPRPGSPYCGDDCTPTWRAAGTTSDHDGTAMRRRPEVPVPHRRFCVHCDEHARPRPGRRAPGELCDLCGHCGRAFPGPRLTTTVSRVGEGAHGWTMRLGPVVATRYLDTGDDPAGLQWTLDRLEVRVLRQFARRHPERRDAAGWLAAHLAHERRRHHIRAHQIYASQIASALVDRRAVLGADVTFR